MLLVFVIPHDELQNTSFWNWRPIFITRGSHCFHIQMSKQAVKCNSTSKQTFIGRLPCARDHSKPFCLHRFKAYDKLWRQVLLSFYNWGNWGAQHPNNLPKVKCYPDRGGEIQTQAIWLVSNYSFSFPTTIIIPDCQHHDYGYLVSVACCLPGWEILRLPHRLWERCTEQGSHFHFTDEKNDTQRD